jgi:outer membrane biosynthesis protein TonB
LQIIHEYLADKEATRNEDLHAYAQMLVSEVFQAGPYAFANSFFQHPVRRRIAMMTRFTNPRFTYLRKLMFLPLSLVLFCLLAFRVEQKYPGITIQIQKEIKLTGMALSSLTRVPPPPPTQPPIIKVAFAKPRIIPIPDSSQHPESVQVKPLSFKLLASKGYQNGEPYRVGFGSQDEVQDPSIAENPNPVQSVTVLGYATPRKMANTFKAVLLTKINNRFDSIQFIVDGRIMEGYPSELGANRIQSMTVLRSNPELIKVYGYKATNGVIMITTKPGGAAATGPVVQFDSSDNKIFTKVEIEASFHGGSEGWTNYVRNTITHHMDELLQDGQSGTCEVQFIVGKDGSISDVQAMTMQGTKLAKICTEAIANGPKWNPAIQNGRLVTSFRHQKITFESPTE